MSQSPSGNTGNTPPPGTEPSLESFARLFETVHRLRAPGGCPWDRKQTHQTLRPYVIEEAYEVLDVLDQINTPEDLKKDSVKAAFREELGDLLMQVVLHAEMTHEAGVFDVYEVAEALNEKLIRRHPHVFGDVQANDADSAVASWEKQKAKEKADKPQSSVLDGVPRGMPTLQRAGRVIEKVTHIGFQWKDIHGPIEKVEEEVRELKAELLATEVKKDRVEAELGDLFFSLCNIAFLTKVSPEDSLRSFLRRFETRFRHVETRLKETGKSPDQSTLEEMDVYWNEAKAIEKAAAAQ
ncbi:MAG: nucleoside triphosphate pyrophosphohydrolase [Methylotenera sp.]|nr:nucleoside triphosphate pyrophosphohydrolase [Oligoflexia bacterium]